MSKPEITEEQKERARHVAERLTNSGERWLRNFVDGLGSDITYEQVLERASEEDGYMTFGDEISGHIPDEFWDHVESVIGRKINRRATHFSCTC